MVVANDITWKMIRRCQDQGGRLEGFRCPCWPG